MKIFLIRHGESKPIEFPGKDVDRSLTSLGISEIEQLSSELSGILTQQPLIVCSHAVRAVKTAEILSSKWNCVPFSDHELYYGGIENYERIIKNNQDKMNLILVGHNPDISLFASTICRRELRFLPGSCAVILRTIDGEITKNELVEFKHPERKHPN
ncbi:MAG: SixA phosphatase family protein [Cyclobacteriaceae bacterium]